MRSAVAASSLRSKRCSHALPCFCASPAAAPADPPAAPAPQTIPPSAHADTAPFRRSQSAARSRAAISRERRPRPSAVLARGKRLIRLGHIDQMMRHARPLFLRRLRRAQLHAAIHGHRVAAHNLAAKPLRQLERKRRLPAARRPEQNHHERFSLAMLSSAAQSNHCSISFELKLVLGIRALTTVLRTGTAHSRHHPGGKIHFGLVCSSHHRQIAAARISKPNTWLRRNTRVCSARAPSRPAARHTA